MDMKMNLELKQTQKLIMSQNLQLSLHLLQISAMELQELIEKELLENPLLDQNEEDNDRQLTPEEEEWEKTEKDAAEWIEEFEDHYHAKEELEYDPNLPDYEAQFPDRPKTLAEYLLEQLIIIELTAEQHQLLEYIIDSLDGDGFFDQEIDKVAQTLNVKPNKIEEILKIIQTLDPPGVGARDLRECLLIQLKLKFPEQKLAYIIVELHLENLLQKRLNLIAKSLNVTIAEIQHAIEIIATLDPKPGSRFGADYPEDIIPDLIVHQIGDEFIVLFNDRSLPTVRINYAYREMIKRKGDKEARKFIVDKLNSAKFLVKAIDQRRETMTKVMQSIVSHQEEFFSYGISKLKPLTFAQVAEDVERHESTISRVVANKYVETPRGIFELKFFFSGGLITADGGETSAKSVKNLIADIVQQEKPSDPLSDEKIVDLLVAQGIQVARRTVAKYRQQLGIQPKRLRKQYS
jgi:RNA polymerase sigma-54 factor